VPAEVDNNMIPLSLKKNKGIEGILHEEEEKEEEDVSAEDVSLD